MRHDPIEKYALSYAYAIKFPDGTYYTGEVNTEANPNAWKGPRSQAFTYTETGAHRKINMDCFKDCFKGCTVERVL
jgi:hypothetical protein